MKMPNPFTLTGAVMGVGALLASLAISNLIVTGWAVDWLSKNFAGANNFWWIGHESWPIPEGEQYTVYMEQFDYTLENNAFITSGLGLGVAILGLASLFLNMQRRKVFIGIPLLAVALGFVAFVLGIHGYIWNNNRRNELYQDQCQAWMGWPVTNQKTHFMCTRRQMACDFVRYLGKGHQGDATQPLKDAACTSFKVSHTMMVPIAVFSFLMAVVLVLQSVRAWRIGNAQQGRAAKIHDDEDWDTQRASASSAFPSTRPPTYDTYDGASSTYSAPVAEVAGSDAPKDKKYAYQG